MTNFKKRKTRKRHNKNNRKKRTRKLKGGGVINNIKLLIKDQQLKHPLDFENNNIWNNPDGQILKPKWLNILKTGSQILPGIGAVYDNDERFKSYGEMTLSELKKTEKKIIKEISDYDEWAKKCKPFDKKENKLTCDQLAVQRDFDCRHGASNPQEDNPQPQPYQGVSTSSTQSINQSNPQDVNAPLQTGETISPQTTSTPTSRPTTPPTSDDEDDEDNEYEYQEQSRPMVQYPQRAEGATILNPDQTTDQVSSNTKATFNFDSQNPDELSFDVGEEITVTEYKVDNSFDWAKGYKTNDPTKTVGIFPKNYTTLIASDERVSTKACGNLNIPQGATYYIDEEKNWFAEKNDDRISGNAEPRIDGEKSIKYYYNHVTDKVTYDNTDGTCDTKKVEIEGKPFWYKEIENGSVIFRKYKEGKLIREQILYPQIWDSSGKKNLVSNVEEPVIEEPTIETSVSPVSPLSPVSTEPETPAPVTPVSIVQPAPTEEKTPEVTRTNLLSQIQDGTTLKRVDSSALTPEKPK